MAQPRGLTATQQQVVDAMRAGWSLQSQRDSFGGRFSGSLCLVGKDGCRRLNRGLLKQLQKRGLIEPGRRIDWLTTEYVLSRKANERKDDA